MALRRLGKRVEMYLEEEPKSVRAQMKLAGKKAKKIVIMGDREFENGLVKIKHMPFGGEETKPLKELFNPSIKGRDP
jgi:histidyl-tRNA synthetase